MLNVFTAQGGGHSIVNNTEGWLDSLELWDFGWEKIFWGSSKI